MSKNSRIFAIAFKNLLSLPWGNSLVLFKSVTYRKRGHQRVEEVEKEFYNEVV